jgi:amino acid permease
MYEREQESIELLDTSNTSGSKRKLNSRHLEMIAIGGARIVHWKWKSD